MATHANRSVIRGRGKSTFTVPIRLDHPQGIPNILIASKNNESGVS